MQVLLSAFQASSQTGEASIFVTWPPVHEDDIDCITWRGMPIRGPSGYGSRTAIESQLSRLVGT